MSPISRLVRRLAGALVIPLVIPLVIALAIAVSLAAPAAASTLGPLEPHLLRGTDMAWTGDSGSNIYRLTNTSNGGNVKYFVAALPNGTAQEISVSVGVKGLSGANYSGAGLVFNFDLDSRTYLALVLTASNQLAIYQKSAQGMSELARLPQAIDTRGGMVQLTLRATGKGVDIEVDGAHQGAIDGVGLRGQAGILAIDGGDYSFATYEVK